MDTLATPPITNDNDTKDDITEDHTTNTPDDPGENQSEGKEHSEQPTVRNTPDEEVDLSFSGEVSPTALPSHPKPETHRPIKQTTITSLFATKSSVETDPPTREHTPPSSAPLSNTPQLTSMDDFLLERDEELTIELKLERKFTPLEQFQQRFTQHASTKSQTNKMTVKKESKGDELVPEEIMSKVGDKPG